MRREGARGVHGVESRRGASAGGVTRGLLRDGRCRPNAVEPQAEHVAIGRGQVRVLLAVTLNRGTSPVAVDVAIGCFSLWHLE